MNRAAQMPSTRFGGALKLVLIFMLEIAFVVVLHWLGSLENMTIDFANFKQWIDTTPPEIALVASVRILALGFSYWVLATSFMYMAARAFHIPFLIRALELTTIPGVRRAIDAGLAAAIIGGTVFGGAGAVFAKTTNAQVQSGPAAITATYKETRVLFNPTPAGDATGGPTVSLTSAESSPDIVSASQNQQAPTVNVSSNAKVVVAPTEGQPVADTTTPQVDSGGNYIPTPAGSPTTPTEAPVVQEPTTANQKVVIEPTPADSTTSTTSPKVTVPTTTPPVVTTPPASVDVQGKVVQRPNDTPTATTPQSSTYTVVSGDNFWAIAEAQVQNSLGRQPTNAETANYWVKLIDANRSAIRSGDPDLIFPGEVFTLPPI